MFLSKVTVDWRWTKDPYQLHRALWQLFPDRPQEQRDFLFRVEEGRGGSGLNVLLQSIHSPRSAQVATVSVSKEIKLSLSAGMRCYFRLRANPIKSIKDEQGRLNCRGEIKTCRVPLLREEECMPWLARKMADSAQLQLSRMVKEPALLFHKKGISGKIQTVCFEGILVVNHVEEFVSLVRSGIGPAKSMGCGLLSLARA